MARDHGNELEGGGVGHPDSLPEAKEFQEEFKHQLHRALGGRVRFVAGLGHSAQPAGILLDADGEVAVAAGAAPPDEVLAALA